MSVPPPTTPPGWYPDPAGGGGQRYWDGVRWTEHRTNQPPPGFYLPPPQTPPTSNNRRVVLGVVGGFVVLLVIGIVFGGGDKSKTSSTAASSNSGSSPSLVVPSAHPAPTPKPVARIGQPVRDGKFEFVITGVNTAKTVGDPSNEFMQATAQGVFVVVSMTVANIGNQAQSFFAANQKLKDAAGRQFSPDSTADMWINKQIQTDINPGNQVQAQVAFDVPVGTQPSQIELHDSIFSGGVTVNLA